MDETPLYTGKQHSCCTGQVGIEGLRLSQAAMLENPQPRRSDSSHNHRPSAMRCIRPPEALGYHSFLVSGLNSYNAEATFVPSTRTQRFLKIIETLSCWYSLESSHRVLSYEYPFAWVSVIFSFFSIILF